MPARPRADRELNEEIALRAVREQLPTVACKSATLLGMGWATDVYLLDQRLVARFPRNTEVADYVDHDEAVLKLIESELSEFFAVPRVLHRGKAGAHFPHDFMVCEYVPGIGADNPQAPFADALASDLGIALTHIHSIPLAGPSRVGLGQPNWDDYSGPLRFLHGDFSPDNIIVNEDSGRLVGVIDWGNAAIGDPAIDFIWLVCWRGWSFTHAVLDAYGAPREGDFVDRVRRNAQIQALQWLLDSVRRGRDLELHLSWVRNVFSIDGAS